jgi:hypothetical protein
VQLALEQRWLDGLPVGARASASATIDLDADANACPACGGTIARGATRCPSCKLRIG